jgi:hypothetical protein
MEDLDSPDARDATGGETPAPERQSSPGSRPWPSAAPASTRSSGQSSIPAETPARKAAREAREAEEHRSREREEWRQERVLVTMSRGGLIDRRLRPDWDEWDRENPRWEHFYRLYGRDTGSRHAYLVTRQWLAYCGRDDNWAERKIPQSGFLLVGPIGSGKTTLLKAFCRELAEMGVPFRYANCRELQRRVSRGLRDGALDETLDWFQDEEPDRVPRVAVLDEFGQEPPYPWWIDDFLVNLVNRLWEAKTTIILGSVYDLHSLPARWNQLDRERGTGYDPTLGSAASIFSRLRSRVPVAARMSPLDGLDNRTSIPDFQEEP